MINVARDVHPKGAPIRVLALATFIFEDSEVSRLGIMEHNFVMGELIKVSGYTHHNRHLAERYILLIVRWTSNISGKSYVERHHILPKSIWPEYSSLRSNRWNEAVLTARQHFIAHWILARLLGGGMWLALKWMVDLRGLDGRSSRVYELARIEAHEVSSKCAKEQFSTIESRINHAHTMRKWYAENPEQGRKRGAAISASKNTAEGKKRNEEAQKRAKNTPEYLCFASQMMSDRFKNASFRQRHQESLKKTYSDPELRHRISERQRKRYEDPEERRRQSVRIKNAYKNPESRRRASEAQKMDKRRPEMRAHMSAIMKERYKDPEFRQKMSDSIRDAYSKNPEARQRNLDAVKKANAAVVTCPYCKRTGKAGGMKRWHFDNCKYKRSQQ